MTVGFTVRAVPRFRRLARSLTRRYPEFADVYAEAVAILGADPYNRGRTHQIKKLTDVKPGDGQWRLRLGRWRFRYDIEGRDVLLYAAGLRDESTYR